MEMQGNERQELEMLLGEKELFRMVNDLIDEVISKLGDEGKEELGNLAQRLPIMLLNSGALMTVAYLFKRCMGRESQRTETAFKLIKSMMRWLEERGLINLGNGEGHGKGGNSGRDRINCEELSKSVLDELLRKDMREFSWISDELLKYSEALKVLAQARIGEAK